MHLPRRRLLGSLVLAAAPGLAHAATALTDQSPPERSGLKTHFKNRTADWDVMFQKRFVRMIVPYSRTLFFRDKAVVYGVSANNGELLEKWINTTLKTGARPVTVELSPVSRDRLIPALLAGEGDIALGDVTVTPDRAKLVSFTTPVLRNVREVIVTSDDVPDIPSPEALSGMTVMARDGSSFAESLAALNQRLTAEGKAPVKIVGVPPALETEDLMEMAATGLVPAVVADDWIANLWVSLIPRLKIHKAAAIREDGDIAWAVRPSNPQLLAILNRFIAQVGGSTQAMQNRMTVYLRKLKAIHDATSGPEMQKFRTTLAIFERYSSEYGFDTLMLMAQGYQESRLDQNAKSAVGAVGIMQLMPATGQSLRVGNIRTPDPNVHAGAKYMRRLLDTYFKDSHFDAQNRNLFAFAAYNAGPGRVHSLQIEAKKEGLDPNVWFDNVERVCAARVGQETVRYVRNIYKYYIAYTLIEEADAAKKAAIRTVPKSN
jgi:membrane-bound lytic murein transglycosylase MltF